MCSLVLISLFFLFPETNAANILYKRAKRLRKATGDNRLKSQSKIDSEHHTARDDLRVLARALFMVFCFSGSSPSPLSLAASTASASNNKGWFS
jgi:DHA1 family multidrug resistance protein-like MFS transporter